MATILIVEDDLDIRETLSEILQAERYTVLTAGNGMEGLAVLRSLGTPPQVILLDLRMPVMDGREFRIQLRHHARWQAIPVVIYSGTPDFCPPGDLEPLVANLMKPIEIPVLLNVLRTCCVSPEAHYRSCDADAECELLDLELLAA